MGLCLWTNPFYSLASRAGSAIIPRLRREAPDIRPSAKLTRDFKQLFLTGRLNPMSATAEKTLHPRAAARSPAMKGVVFLGDRPLGSCTRRRSRAGPWRSGRRDQGLRHVRQRPAPVPRAAQPGSADVQAIHRRPRASRHRRRRRCRRACARGATGRPRDGASLPWVHRLLALPHRLATAVPSGNTHHVQRQRAWRARAVHEGAGRHAGGACTSR